MGWMMDGWRVESDSGAAGLMNEESQWCDFRGT